jgi:protein-S-isoprenylcysteine O-methyltransferase Ste14
VNSPSIIAAAWIFWSFLHSFLISGPLTAIFGRVLGRRYAFFRISYNLFSLISASIIFLLQLRLPQQLLWNWHGKWLVLQGALLSYAFFMFAAGGRVYDLGVFSGISQIRAYGRNTPPASLAFTCKGILKFVRHPWYSGGLAFLWGAGQISDVSLAAKVVLSLYLIIGCLVEENKLLAALGEEYAAYRRQVPMLIPWKSIGRLFIDGKKK